MLYHQIASFESTSWEELTLQNPLILVFAIVLVFPNIWLAYLKWKVTLKGAQIDVPMRIRSQSFFAGIVTGMLTPNMVGNFIGRLYYFDREHRPVIIGLTLIANYAQFLSSITFGVLAVYMVGELYVLDINTDRIYALLFLLLVIYLLYFTIEFILKLLKNRFGAENIVAVLSQQKMLRLKLLGLSFLRFIVFTSQFLLMLHAFGAEISLDLLFAIWQVYLLTMIVPSLFLGKVGIKESISLAVLSLLGINSYAILFTSLLIWFVNSMSPALIGLVVCRNRGDV